MLLKKNSRKRKREKVHDEALNLIFFAVDLSNRNLAEFFVALLERFERIFNFLQMIHLISAMIKEISQKKVN